MIRYILYFIAAFSIAGYASAELFDANLTMSDMSSTKPLSIGHSYTNPIGLQPTTEPEDEITIKPVESRLLLGSGSSPWRKAPLAVGATYLAYQYDEEIQAYVQANRTPTTDRIADYVKLFGDGEVMGMAVGAAFIYGKLLDSDRAVRLARVGFESILLGGLTTQIIKNSVLRVRPSGVPGEDPFDLPDIGHSFPSGHTTVAFAVATVLSDEFGSDLAPFLAYGLATLTGWSRINDNDHWLSDVIAGAFIGYISAKTAIRYELEPINSSERSPSACPIMMRFAF